MNKQAELIMEEQAELTKKNFFDKFKPLSDTKVFTNDGNEIKSEAVLALIKELKQFITKNDVDGFWNFMQDKSKRTHLSIEEKQFLQKTVVIEEGYSVIEILALIDDLKENA